MTEKHPSFLDAALPVIVLIVLLSASVYLFGNDSSYGPNQIALFIATAVAVIIGLKNGYKWQAMENAMVSGISLSLGAVLILLSVGALIGTWMLSGTVPTLIYYGLQLLSPSWFYAASCLLCGIVAMSIGSSWTTAATIGVALIGVASGLGLSPAITAGAIVSGAYFGDKLSPLSETTNLAPAVAGAELFQHIQHMLWTTVPSFVLALLLFTIIGFNSDITADFARIEQISLVLKQQFAISLVSLVPLLVLLAMAIKKVPAFPTVFIGALLGALWAVFFQQELLARLIDSSLPATVGVFKLVWHTFYAGFAVDTGDNNLNELLSGGGMASMLNTIWLVFCAMMFGATIEKIGLLRKFVESILYFASSTGSLITSTIATCFVTNLLTADQYMSIVMPGRMFKEEYKRRGLAPVNLSRSLEDGGTITSPLIPWNTCGAYMHSVLGVSPLDYAFYAFFNLINPLLSIVYAYLGIKVLRLSPPATTRQTEILKS
ncbi:MULTISPECIES: Na+/H+ antiporter NhaC [unclassified Arsukibacterium]|uniref:Na+/H+ antiporter NhaC n=1 Tax=unclassified Arsukibacterium TaxID=2635278 RepID=UPI000C37D240|nr:MULTISPECIES: Na+/H+ antiporter NhaC [unclassified Arsukibacterium]MAA94015.1 Na+/H+ antiporter NhaC [Rheinheimera sp.]MBM33388.1 Na+/H+ antiporter NhaC [Rheinheimera sp.]HAW92537.1 Na+/H+ antiporter NhaC [Candidatus Azambacteria bacterium]|tara:strand:- start:5855 stop:7324 length:1470 start_codon:yes stop_codon:yes gene_type:complete